jgi:hypothetical protein
VAFLAATPQAQAQSGYGFKVRIGNFSVGGFKVEGDRHEPQGHHHVPHRVVTPRYVPVDPYPPVDYVYPRPVVRERIVVAPEPVVVVPRRHFHVLYRTCHHSPWREYGSYRSHGLAHDVVDELRFRGYQAKVLHH